MAGAMLLLTVAAAAQQPTVKIWPGVAPGSEDWSQPEGVMIQRPLTGAKELLA